MIQHLIKRRSLPSRWATCRNISEINMNHLEERPFHIRRFLLPSVYLFLDTQLIYNFHLTQPTPMPPSLCWQSQVSMRMKISGLWMQRKERHTKANEQQYTFSNPSSVHLNAFELSKNTFSGLDS